MKNVILALGLVLAYCTTMQASAASTTITFAGDTSDINVSDTWTFNVVSDGVVDLARISGVAGNLEITLNDAGGTLFTRIEGFSEFLAIGTYHIVFADLAVGPGAYEFGLTGEVSQVPLPAAAWLFGSAVLGLTLVARRRRTSSVA